MEQGVCFSTRVSAKGQLRCGEIHPAAIEDEPPVCNDLAITSHDSYVQAFSGEKP
jgi:hypothetical protein